MQIVYAREPRVTPEELGAVFAASGIRRPSGDLARLEKMIEHANLILTARVDGKLIGVVRAWNDESFMCFVSCLAVDRAYQRRGIGKELLRRVKELVGDEVSVGLFAAPAAESYYPHIGFEPVSAWRIPRAR